MNNLAITRKRTWQAALLSVLTLVSVGSAVVTASPQVAHADPGCKRALLVDARGSVPASASPGLHPWSGETYAFFNAVDTALGLGTSYDNVVQLGDEDGNGQLSSNEYPAVGGSNWVAFQINDGTWNFPGYGVSVRIGTDELVAYLNQRVISCPQEAIVLGGFSQGADVIGWALQRSGYGALSAAARQHIAYVALYGDPTFDAGNPYDRQSNRAPWWVRGNSPGWYDIEGVPSAKDGILGPRSPYAPSDFQGRFGSWCDQYDDACNGDVAAAAANNGGSHTYTYAQYWIQQSAPEIARATLGKIVQLNPWLGDWNHDGQPDFFAFNKADAGSGKTVYYVLNGFNPSQTLQVGATPFGWTDSNWSFAPGYDFNNDGTPELYAFNKHDAGSGKTVYYILNGRDPGGPAVQIGATPFGWTDANFSLSPGPDFNHDGTPDIYAFNKQDAGSGKTVYYILDGHSPEHVLQVGATPFGFTDGNWSFAPGQDWNGDGTPDLYAFNKRDGGSGKTVYFVLNGRDPGQFLQIGATAFGWTGDNYSFMPGPDWNHDGRPDLYAFDRQDGGSGHTVYFVMNGQDPAQFLQVGTTPFGWTDNNWQFGVFNG